MRVGFTPREVIKLTGVPYSTLNLWAKSGLVAPSIESGIGSGNERIYSLSDVAALKVALDLRKAGVTTKSLQKVVDFVRRDLEMDKPLHSARLIVSGRDVLLVEDDRHLISTLSKPGQGCLSFVVDLSRTLGDLFAGINSATALVTNITQPQARTFRKGPASEQSAKKRRLRA